MSKSSNLIIKLDPAKPSIAYDTYWKFAYERQNIFVRRFKNYSLSLTQDPILTEYKFTNVYRVCDRVSQFLIRNVIYDSQDYSGKDILFRTLLFKLFNKIETWQLLKERFGNIRANDFDLDEYKHFLDSEMNCGRVLYSNAYMMASGCKDFAVTRKHHAHLMLLKMMLEDGLAEQLQECKRMRDAYTILLSYPLIGQFLAYQYVTDLNYSELVNFSEREFTIPGPGAKDGIKKCFISLGGLTEIDIVKLMADRQEHEFERLGLDFKTLGDRPLQYIDIQNIFCEVDKYCRVAHPELSGYSGRTRIKQKFKPNEQPIQYFFPPKWKITIGAI